MKFRFVICVLILSISVNCTTKKNDDSSEKILIDLGDSLTWGAGGKGTTMSSITSDLLGDEWTVKNMGIGGENTLTIGARYGAIPMYIKESIVIPKDGSKVEIPTGLYSTYNDSNILPLLQGDGGINPCFIDDIECELTRTDDKYFINRISVSNEEHTTNPRRRIVTSLSKETKGIATIFIGQNGGFDNVQQLVDQIKMFVNHKGNDRVIIITSHGNGFPETVAAIKAVYGNKLIDLKNYMSTTAIYDAIKLGLLPDDRTYPTEADFTAMKNSNAPPSLLIDRIHFNAIGYELLGRLRFKKGQELGYW